MTSTRRIIIVDDDAEWCALMGYTARMLGYDLDSASTLEEARLRLEEAGRRGLPYAVAIIDKNFVVGTQRTIELSRGFEVVQYIKSSYPTIACIMVSGAPMSAAEVLDLRDDYGLDYYLQKDQADLTNLRRAIEKATARLAAQGDTAPKDAGTRVVREQHSPGSVSPPAAAPIQVTLDFHAQRGGAAITWRAPLVGREVTSFTPPYDDALLPLIVRALNVVQYPAYPAPSTPGEQSLFAFSAPEQRQLAALGLWHDGRVAPAIDRVVGQQIYAALGADGQDVLKSVRNAGIAQRAPISYVLRFPPDAVGLAALPWEMLWDDERNQAVLINGTTVDSCERYVDMGMALPPPLHADERPHLLALLPRYGIPEQIQREEREARLRTWDALRDEGRLTYHEIAPLTVAALNDYLMSSAVPPRVDVVHFFGHGIYQNGKGYLVFDSEDGGRDYVSAERIAAVLGQARLVVIHACQSATVDDRAGLLTGVAPSLSVWTQAVVAMQLTVRIASAKRFSQVFYNQLLGKGRSIQESVAAGRRVLFSETPDGASWYVPTIYIRSRDAQPVYIIR